jgi:hypothetical protein
MKTYQKPLLEVLELTADESIAANQLSIVQGEEIVEDDFTV